jgi:hypothetical protein
MFATVAKPKKLHIGRKRQRKRDVGAARFTEAQNDCQPNAVPQNKENHHGRKRMWLLPGHEYSRTLPAMPSGLRGIFDDDGDAAEIRGKVGA